MWRINQRVNKLGQSLRRIIYSPNWSISLCGCQDTCGPALWCGEHVQAPAENPLAPERGTAWSLNLRCRGGVERVLLCVSENMYFWWLQVCGENVQAPFFLCLPPKSSSLCDYTTYREKRNNRDVVGHIVHPVCLSLLLRQRLSLSGFSLTGHICACSSLTTDSTHCPSLRASPAALFWVACMASLSERDR